MKTQLALALLACSLAIFSCGTDDADQPAQWLMYFTFQNNEEQDFFIDSEYSPDSVFMVVDDVETRFHDVQLKEDRHIYGWVTWAASSVPRSVFYISFGNGDIDTLMYQWEPNSIRTVSPASFNRLETVYFYYNGDLVETWDMEQDSELEQQLINRNTPPYPSLSADNPIVITLPKKPEL